MCWHLRRSYKGSALALMVEILGGALAGGAVEAKGAARNWGSLVAAIDPASLGGAAAFRARVSALLRRVKAARPAPGVAEVRLPGENSAQLAGVAVGSAHMIFCSHVVWSMATRSTLVMTCPVSCPLREALRPC